MVWFIIYFILIGLVAGALARLLVPGRDPMGCVGTMVLGMIGSFVGGFLGYVIFGHDLSRGAFQTSGFFGSLIGAIIVLLLWRWWKSHHPSTVHH